MAYDPIRIESDGNPHSAESKIATGDGYPIAVSGIDIEIDPTDRNAKVSFNGVVATFSVKGRCGEKNYQIVSDGTTSGTSIFDENGKRMQWEGKVRWRININDGFALIEANFINEE